MKLLAVGINHNTASLALRERVSFVLDAMPDALRKASLHNENADVVILSTCNRTEIYITGCDEPQAILNWLAHYHKIDEQELHGVHYHYRDEDAVRHLMRVASGLDSQILGEPQIFGQMKSALALAREIGTANGSLHHIFQQVFSVAKRVRAETSIGQNPVSVAYAAVRLAKHIFSDLSTSHALLIGAGKTIELVARHLREQGVGYVLIANRSIARAQALAQIVGGEAMSLADIPARLHEADIVISSTASQLPILGKGAVEHALKRRRHRPMFMVDIAVPRDIEAQVGELDDVYLYTVDDLHDVIDENLRAREVAAEEAQVLVDEGLASYRQHRRTKNAVADIVAYRQQAEKLRDSEVEKALAQLARGDDVDLVLRGLARNLTNKLLHQPTTVMKQLL